MKRLLILLIVLAFVPAHAQALDTSGLRALTAMPLAVDACARSGRVPPDQLGYYASRLNAADVPPPAFIETVRYAPVVVQQPDFFPFVDSEISQGVAGDALVTVIEQRVRGYGYDVRRGDATPAWVLSDNYIPRFDSYRTTVRRTAYNTRSDRYDRRTILYLIEMPLAVATVSDYGVPQDRLARFCGTLNRGYLPPEQFVDTVRYAPQVIVERPDFVPFIEVQIGNGITGLRLFDVIHPQLTAYVAPREVFSPSYVLADQYIPQTVRARYAQARVNPGFVQQPAFVPQPVIQQPVYVPPQQAQQRFRRQAPNVARSVQQPVVIQSPQVVHIPPGRAKKEARQAEGRVHGQGHGKGRQQVVQPVVVAPPPMASAAPPAPVMVAPPPHDNGHGRGPGGQGPPGQQKDKEKGGKGHGKD